MRFNIVIPPIPETTEKLFIIDNLTRGTIYKVTYIVGSDVQITSDTLLLTIVNNNDNSISYNYYDYDLDDVYTNRATNNSGYVANTLFYYTGPFSFFNIEETQPESLVEILLGNDEQVINEERNIEETITIDLDSDLSFYDSAGNLVTLNFDDGIDYIVDNIASVFDDVETNTTFTLKKI